MFGIRFGRPGSAMKDNLNIVKAMRVQVRPQFAQDFVRRLVGNQSKINLGPRLGW
jgi:hypothetical protein